MDKVNEYYSRIYEKLINEEKPLVENIEYMVNLSLGVENMYDRFGGKFYQIKNEKYISLIEKERVREILIDIFPFIGENILDNELENISMCIDIKDLIKLIKRIASLSSKSTDSYAKVTYSNSFEFYALIKLYDSDYLKNDIKLYLFEKLKELGDISTKILPDAILLDIYRKYGTITFENMNRYQKETGVYVYLDNYSGNFVRYGMDLYMFPIALEMASNMFNIKEYKERIISKINEDTSFNELTEAIQTKRGNSVVASQVLASYGNMLSNAFNKTRKLNERH